MKLFLFSTPVPNMPEKVHKCHFLSAPLASPLTASCLNSHPFLHQLKSYFRPFRIFLSLVLFLCSLLKFNWIYFFFIFFSYDCFFFNMESASREYSTHSFVKSYHIFMLKSRILQPRDKNPTIKFYPVLAGGLRHERNDERTNR